MSDFLARIEKLSPKRLALLAYELQTRLEQAERERADPIAVVGVGCRFPGADGPAAFWRLLDEGRDAVTEVPADRWDVDAFYDADPDAPGRVATRWGGFLGRVDGFDAPFFGISRREAVSMDPQQRLLLEVCWEALEHAGQSPRALAGSATGVFAGMSTGDYYGLLRARGLENMDAYTATGTAHSVAAGRVAYVLGLHGPNIAVDTACSSSLVAVHLACQSLRAGESRVALAGGVNLILAPDITVALSRSHMMAPDGRCKAFDARADGFVRGEGCGVVVLKRLGDARADGDRVLAVIRGSAANQDGRSSGITAPNGASQQQVIRRALESAGVRPDEVGYVEAHGTGTSLGDPIEAHALAAEFRGRAAGDPLVVGSVKANVGHLEAAAGVAGLIKVVLSLQHGRIPGQLHFGEMNPHIDWGGLPVEIPVGGREWAPGVRRRVAGVSAFGFSGTNAHVVVEEAPRPGGPPGDTPNADPDAAADRPAHLLALSARTGEGLRELAAAYAARVADGDDPVADVCFTANAGRSHFAERAAYVARSRDELAAALRAEPAVRGAAEGRPKLAFLFTGQGAQWAGMGRELYDTQPVFRRALDRCAATLAPHLDRPLLDLLYGDAGALLGETAYAQPALVAVEWALFELWRSWGVAPSAALGHSVGEYAALCAAGAWELEDGLRLVAERGRMMQALEGGWGMCAVQAPRAGAAAALAGLEAWVSVAAANAPASTVLSGRLTELAVAEGRLAAAGVQTRRLAVSHAFHSPQMDAVADAFARLAAAVPCREPALAVISSVTGRPLAAADLRDPRYWRRQVRDAVEFEAAVATLTAQGYDTFVEVGPSPTLLGLARQCDDRDGLGWVPSLRRERGATEQMLDGLAQLYARGAEVDWAGFDAPFVRQRVALPTYPFQRQRYWVEGAPAPAAPAAARRVSGHAMLGGRVPAAVPIFEAPLSAEAFPFLDDHRVGGAAVLPGAVYAELALAAAAEAFGRADVVRDLELREPLRLGAAGHTVQVVLTPAGAEQAAFQILGRPADAPDGAWTMHASGAVGGRGATADADLAALRRRITHALPPDDFYGALRARGIELGARCQTLRALWAGEGEVLAEVALDPSLAGELGAYRFHPALLDGCLQAFGTLLWRTAVGDATRVLTRVGRLQLLGAPAARVWCHAAFDAELGTGRLAVFDDAGRLVAEAAGLEAGAIGVAPAAAAQPIDDWFYELAWTPKERAESSTAGAVLADGALAERLRGEASALFDARQLGRYHALHPELAALAAAYVGAALRAIGCDLVPGRRFTTAEGADAGRVVPQHRRLFARLLDILAEDGFLRRPNGERDAWEVVGRPTADPAALVPSLVARFPDYAAELALTARCGARLGEVLQGAADPLHLLFPGGSVAELEGLYTESPSAHVFNPLVRQAVLDAVAAAPPGRRARVLEIGAGTGGTTAFVAPALPADRVEYTFTDVSPLFLARAEERFGQYPFMRYAVLDVEADAGAADVYDVVIAANVLHAAADLRRAVANARARLAPGGLLVLLEGTRPERWVDLTFGMTDGWWRFADHALRPDYPLVDAPTWLALLGELGFRHAAAVAPRQGAQQVVLVAQAPDEAPGRWLVAADAGGLGAALARQIEASGGAVTLRAAGDAPSAWPFAGHDHVVDLRGVDVAAGVDAAQVGAGLGAADDLLAAMRAATASGVMPRLWVVTRGAQAAGGAPARPAAMQAALWGLGRTFALEHPDAWGGLCDLDPAAPDDRNAAALLAAVRRAGGDDQLAVRGDALLVPRLERRDAPPAAAPAFSPDGAYLVTGGLGNLGLRAAEWLVAHGARRVVLNGRAGLPERAEWEHLDPNSAAARRVRAVRALEARGATVAVLAADLARPGAGAALAAAFAPGELRGILHAAAVFDTAAVEQLSAAELRRVLDAKVAGAGVVSDLARAAGVDWCVLFSSTTSLLGARGMAAYAAANQALDAHAHALRADGVPALAVNWGTWDELGDVPEAVRQSYVRAGLLPMPSAVALDALGRALAAGATQLTVAQIDWTALKAVYQARRRRPLLERVANRTHAPADAAAPGAPAVPDARAGATSALALLPDAERARRLAELVRADAAAVLGVRVDEVDPQQGLFEMGMDSLMSVELRARLERTVGRKLPSTLTFNHPNVRALAAYLGSLFVSRPAVPPPRPAPAAPPVAAPPAAVAPDDLSEDQMAAMLSDALESLR